MARLRGKVNPPTVEIKGGYVFATIPSDGLLWPEQARKLAEELTAAAKAIEWAKKFRGWRVANNDVYLLEIDGVIKAKVDFASIPSGERNAFLFTRKGYLVSYGRFPSLEDAKEAVEKAVAEGLEIND